MTKKRRNWKRGIWQDRGYVRSAGMSSNKALVKCTSEMTALFYGFAQANVEKTA